MGVFFGGPWNVTVVTAALGCADGREKEVGMVVHWEVRGKEVGMVVVWEVRGKEVGMVVHWEVRGKEVGMVVAWEVRGNVKEEGMRRLWMPFVLSVSGGWG